MLPIHPRLARRALAAPVHPRWPGESWRLAPLVLPILLPLCDPAAKAREITAPAAIDRAVTAFTGVPVGAPGGARAPADPRLQLAACAAPLAVRWHGEARAAVAVECAGPEPWRIFVSLAGEAAGAAKAAQAVRRGDALTILVRGRGFAIQQPGEALGAGAVGEWIAVRPSRPVTGGAAGAASARGEPLRARIERPGLVVIPLG